MRYKHILLPIDFSDSSNNTIQHALTLSQLFDSKITLINYVEPLPAATYGPGLAEMEMEMKENAEKTMLQWADKYKIPKENLLVEIAHAKTTITTTAKEIGADLIVIGHHGHHGLLSDIIGSTSSTVANHANCDVFIVRSESD